jgi:hypothetical protein
MAVPLATKLLSSTLIAVSGSIFLYYVFLVAILPLVEKESTLRSYFPDPYYAVALPLIFLVLLLSAVCIAAGVVMIRATQINDETPLSEPRSRTPSKSSRTKSPAKSSPKKDNHSN